MSTTGGGNGAPKPKRAKRDGKKKAEPATEKKSTSSASKSAIPPSQLPLLMPIPLADPRPVDTLHPRPHQLNLAATKHSEVLGKSWNFYEVADKVSNRNGFRYTYAVEDPLFPCIRYRQTDTAPHHTRFSYEDSPAAMAFTEDGRGVTTSGSWHSARANVCAREGTYYYEARVISGMVRPLAPGPSARGNVRLGFGRREADLDVNVGVDCYGYGIRDVNGEVVNRMRCESFFPKGEAIYEGDVIGMVIKLPSLALHKKIVEGSYDPSVDGDGSSKTGDIAKPTAMNLVRDRIPFHLKSDLMYQQSHIFASKHLRDYAFNLKEPPSYTPSPQNLEDPSLRTLPSSSITIYKNGVKMGTPFENLYAFLPPASRLAQASNNLGVGERENADDGMIGYYPMVSCHNGGAVECRFEAPWFIGPPVGDFPGLKSFGDRLREQTVEDAIADIVDEVDASFAGWSLSVQPTPAAATATNNTRVAGNGNVPSPNQLNMPVAAAPVTMAEGTVAGPAIHGEEMVIDQTTK